MCKCVCVGIRLQALVGWRASQPAAAVVGCLLHPHFIFLPPWLARRTLLNNGCPARPWLPCAGPAPQVMISGVTGEPFPVDIYIGVVYYQRLRHMVSDKFQVRAGHAACAGCAGPAGCHQCSLGGSSVVGASDGSSATRVVCGSAAALAAVARAVAGVACWGPEHSCGSPPAVAVGAMLEAVGDRCTRDWPHQWLLQH